MSIVDKGSMMDKRKVVSDIQVNVSDDGQPLTLARRGDMVVIVGQGLNDSFEVYLDSDPDKATFYAYGYQLSSF